MRQVDAKKQRNLHRSFSTTTLLRLKKLTDIHSRTIQVYEKHAHGWDKHRPRVFFEKNWLDKFFHLLPEKGSVLDVGCGTGKPIAEYFIKHGFNLKGLDASSNMLEIAKNRFPDSSWVEMDMRQLELDATFDGIISWDGFFHLNQEEQRQTLVLFADHLTSNGALLLTIGHEAGEVTGTVEGEEVYHSSLAPEEYSSILNSLGFDKVEIVLEDERCGCHSVLLAKRNVST